MEWCGDHARNYLVDRRVRHVNDTVGGVSSRPVRGKAILKAELGWTSGWMFVGAFVWTSLSASGDSSHVAVGRAAARRVAGPARGAGLLAGEVGAASNTGSSMEPVQSRS